jgi:hypothetical protein
MIAYWFKTYIRHFGKGANKKEKKGKVVTTGMSSGFALVARAARSRRALVACSHLQLLFCTAKNI